MLGDYLDDAAVWLNDSTKPRRGFPLLPQTGGCRSGTVLALDPDTNSYACVPAIWDIARNKYIPIDSKYRDPYDNPARPLLRNQFTDGNGIDFGGPLNLSFPGSPQGNIQMAVPDVFAAQVASQGGSDGGGWLLIAGVLLVVYLMSR